MPQFSLRRRGPLVPTLVILGVLILVVTLAAQLWTDVLWYDSVGFTKVFWVELWTSTGSLWCVVCSRLLLSLPAC